MLDSSTDELKGRYATLDRKEDDQNELKRDSTVEQDDSETKTSNDNDGREDDCTNSKVEVQDNPHRRDPIKQQNLSIKPGCRVS